MAKKYRNILNMQFDMLLKTKRYNEEHSELPKRKASGALTTDPKSGKTYRIVG